MTTHLTSAGSGWAPDVVSTFDPNDKLSEALIIQASSYAGTVEGDTPQVLVPYVSADPVADVAPEGSEIVPNEGTLDQIAISTDKVAVISRVSREMVSQSGAASRIADSLKRAVTAKADALFMSNATSPTGLLNTAGVATAGDLGGTTDPNLFAAYDAVAAIEDDGGQATHLLINPLDWGTLSKLPTGTGSNQSLLADVHNAAERSLAGVPVIVHSAVTQGTALMLDRSEVVSAYGPLQIARSEHALFVSDAIAIRATFRLGWNVVRPARLQLLTVGAA